jgi:hypothetical protein
MIPVNQGTVKAFILIIALIVFAVILLSVKIVTEESWRTILRKHEQLFVIALWTALVLLLIIFAALYFINNPLR